MSVIVSIPRIPIPPPMFATTFGTNLSFTQAPYDWSGTVNVGASVSQRLVESRTGKIFAFYSSNNGAAVSSDGGQTWTPCTGLNIGLRIVSLVYAGGNYIAVPEAGTNVYKSALGVAFTASNYAGDSQNTTCAYASGGTVIVARTNSSQSRRSTDGGNTWANCPLVSSTQVWTIADSGTVLLGVSAASGVFKSVDNGATWSNIGNPIVGSISNLASVAFGNGRFIVINGAGQCATSLDNGVTWSNTTSTPQSLGTIGEGNEFIFDGVNFIVACNVNIYTSPTGQTWTARNALSASAIAFYRAGQNI